MISAKSFWGKAWLFSIWISSFSRKSDNSLTVTRFVTLVISYHTHYCFYTSAALLINIGFAWLVPNSQTHDNSWLAEPTRWQKMHMQLSGNPKRFFLRVANFANTQSFWKTNGFQFFRQSEYHGKNFGLWQNYNENYSGREGDWKHKPKV